MRQTERVTVTMHGDHAEAVRELVAAGQAESISSYVADAVARQLARDAALARLHERFGEPPAEALAWARRTLGADADPAQAPA
jgi:antitoxin ParD1/3/4